MAPAASRTCGSSAPCTPAKHDLAVPLQLHSLCFSAIFISINRYCGVHGIQVCMAHHIESAMWKRTSYLANDAFSHITVAMPGAATSA